MFLFKRNNKKKRSDLSVLQQWQTVPVFHHSIKMHSYNNKFQLIMLCNYCFVTEPCYITISTERNYFAIWLKCENFSNTIRTKFPRECRVSLTVLLELFEW